MTSPTKGPWRVRGNGDTLCVVDQESAYIVDRFVLGGHSYEEKQANAKLIAEAPAMTIVLDLIRLGLGHFDGCHFVVDGVRFADTGDYNYLMEWINWDYARGLIAQKEGRSA